MMTWQPAILALSLISAAAAATPVFNSDAASKVSWKFKDKPQKDVSKIILEWEPFSMLEDTTGVDSKGGVGVNIKSGDGEFIPWTVEPRIRGGKYNYVIDIVPCVDHVIQLYAKNNEGISYFDGFANTIPASSAEDISRSTYVLQTPTNARHETVNSGDSVVVYWDPVQCAKSYGVEFRGADETITKTSDETKYEMTELDQCSEYDIHVYAIIEDVVFSDFSDAGTVQTLPSVKAGSKIDPQVTATQNNVHISWNGHSALSCVNTYLVTLCPLTGECHEPAQVRRDVHMSSVDFTADGLDTCTDYDVTIKPEYPDMNIVPQEFSFHTAFPDPAELVSELGNVTAVSGANQQVTVSWSSVSCAPTYNVYQKLLDGDNDWELAGSTDKESLEFAGVPCTEYKYGVRVVLDGEQSDIVETEDSVVTPLAGDAFYPPKLEINSYPTRFDFSWDHASCISSYNVQLCTLGGECQVADPVISDDGHVDTSFPDLEFCSDYTLKISASTGDNVLPGETITVRTVAPHPAAPENLNYELNDKANAIKLSYDPVVCATGYKIYQILEGDQTEVVTETNDNIVSLDSPPPCSDFRYVVSAVVDGKEGSKSEVVEGKIAPLLSKGSKPTLEVTEKFNKTVMLTLSLPQSNTMCEVESYEVQYLNLGENDKKQTVALSAADLKDGKIVLDNFPLVVDKGVQIEGRIKYLGFDSWSPWISSKSQKPEIILEQGNGVIVPIVIGALIAIVVLVVLIFFIVRRKKSQNKYNCDKGDVSEQKKLNEEA